MSYSISAGAGKAVLAFPDAMFPTDGFMGVHDLPHVRLLVLDAGVRVAIAAMELVNVPEDGIEESRRIIERVTGTPFENVWVHATHAITTPHAPGGPGLGPKKNGAPPPPPPPSDGKEKRPPRPQDPLAAQKRELFMETLRAAVTEAAAQAKDSFRPARLGIGTGLCDVNTNRDYETPFGWWVGFNREGPSNKVMTVLKAEDAEGRLIGTLLSYGVKPCAIDNAEMGKGTRLVSSDVPGKACAVVEEALGAPCLFTMSAAGDQVPREQAWFSSVSDTGEAVTIDNGVAAGLEIVERLGKEMGEDALAIIRDTVCPEAESEIRRACGFVTCDARAAGRMPQAPSRTMSSEVTGSIELDTDIIALGDTALVAVKPETNCVTEEELQKASPYAHTLLMSMVNGGMKYMPDQSSYDRVTWEAQNNSLAAGSAERWVDMAAEVLREVRTEKPLPAVTAIAEPRPEGEKLVAVSVTFPEGQAVTESITVRDRTVVKAETNGQTVTLTLSEDEEAAEICPNPKPDFTPKPGGPGVPGGPGGPKKPMPTRERRPVEVSVSVAGITQAIRSSAKVERVIDDFTQHVFKGIPFNLYLPAGFDSETAYPLILFIADASANGPDPLVTLSQGIGATVWAEPEEQARHPAIVLAPQIPKEVMLTRNDHTAAPEIEIIRELVEHIAETCHADRTRIYATGQSQGCMASMELNIRYPDLFAASLFVSGHWDIDKMTQLTQGRFFFGLSSGGRGEFPNMNAITDGLEARGVKVGRVHLNFREGWDVNNAKVRSAAEGNQVVYAIFDEETAFPDDGKERPGIAHHNRGWELTYQLESARDWLFAQHR